MTFFYLTFFAAAFIFSFLINSLFLRFSKTLGIRDKNETVIRWASTSKPAFGGISFYIVFLLSFASYSMFFEAQEVLLNKKIVGLLGTVTIAFMMGLADDAYNTRPFLKLFVQILCGAILCYSGIHIGIFSDMTLNYFITVLWIVGIMNSVNMLDNMDSIAAIVSLMIFATAAMLIYLSNTAQNNIYFLILTGLIGSLAGFMIFNWHPSKLYMGDTGSQVIGLMLAIIGIVYFWNDTASPNAAISISRQFLIVITAFILPLTDTTIVVINRLSDKRSPFVGGRDHTTHNLFFRGVTERRIALLFAGIGLISMAIVYYIQTRVEFWGMKQFGIFLAYPVIIFLAFFSITKMKRNIVNGAGSKNLHCPRPCHPTLPGYKMKNALHKFKALFSGWKRFWGITALLILLLIPLELFIFSTAASEEDDLYWKAFLANNKIYAVPIPKDLQFANEKVPVYDFTVLESMERELLVNTYFHSQTILMHKRANRWLPLIEKILKKNGVPDDFKYIALIESNLSNAISPKGATGFWQFIGSAAKQYNLEVNDEVDERYDVEKSTEAACRYFKDAYRTFGNWTLAAASYNVGIDGLQKQIDRQKTNSYYELSLNEETARYIFRILTVKEVISHPKQYGYNLRKKDLYPSIPTMEVKIDSGITDLAAFAQSQNLSYKILKYFNPWLRKNYLTNQSKKTYILDIPKPGYNEEYIARLSSADSLGIRPAEPATVPIHTPDSLR